MRRDASIRSAPRSSENIQVALNPEKRLCPHKPHLQAKVDHIQCFPVSPCSTRFLSLFSCSFKCSRFQRCELNAVRVLSSAVTEWGDDVRPISEEEAMVIVNHQSTGDVCTLMMCLQDKGTVSRETLPCKNPADGCRVVWTHNREAQRSALCSNANIGKRQLPSRHTRVFVTFALSGGREQTHS